MDPDSEILAALGLLLTQLRSARRALEDVQRSTARYGGFEFARAFAEGPRFGAPPLFDGALKVHVVNINDLAPGNSFGGFLEALFGGVGNFFGNLIGGVVGGTLSGFRLPKMLDTLERIVINIGKIVDRLGISKKDKDKGKEKDAKKGGDSTPEAQANTGETLLTTIEGIKELVKNVTALFQVTTSGPDAAAKTSKAPMSEAGERWMAILNGVNIFLERTGRLVNGLILLIPMAVGAIAFLIANLGEIRRALLETIQFILRNALILRGVLLTIVFETVASAARLAASIVGIIGETIQSVLKAIFAIVQSLLQAAFDALETITDALQAIIGSLLEWLVNGVFNTLRAIGELSVFRTIDHLVRILPSLLPAIYLLKAGKDLPPNVMSMLEESHKAGFAKPASSTAQSPSGAINPSGTSPTKQVIGDFPDLKKFLKPLGGTLEGAVDATGATVEFKVQESIDSMTKALSGVASRFDKEVLSEADMSRKILERHGDVIKQRSDTLASSITKPIEAKDAPTGLEAIANAYQGWLTGGGIKTVLDHVDEHFKAQVSTGEPGGTLSLLRGKYDRANASVEIDEVEIVLDPVVEEPEEEPFDYGPGDYPLRSDEDVWLAVRRHEEVRDIMGHA